MLQDLYKAWLALLFGIDYSHRLENVIHLGLYSLSGKTSYRKISWSLEAARFGFKLFQSLWNLAGTSAALLPRCLSNFRAIRPLQRPISRLRDFTRFGGKTSYRLVNRGPAGTDGSINTISADASATTILAMWDDMFLYSIRKDFNLVRHLSGMKW